MVEFGGGSPSTSVVCIMGPGWSSVTYGSATGCHGKRSLEKTDFGVGGCGVWGAGEWRILFGENGVRKSIAMKNGEFGVWDVWGDVFS